MSLLGLGQPGMTLKSLLENPDLQTAPSFNQGNGKSKKDGSYSQVNVGSAFLGPNLWDKTHSDNDFNLEYMDLDEFLSENGIPINLDDNSGTHEPDISLLANALTAQRTPPRQASPVQVQITGPVQVSSPQQSPGVYMPESPVHQYSVSDLSLSPLPTPPSPDNDNVINVSSPVMPHKNENQVKGSQQESSSSKPKVEVHVKTNFAVTVEDLSLVNIPAHLESGPTSPSLCRALSPNHQPNSVSSRCGRDDGVTSSPLQHFSPQTDTPSELQVAHIPGICQQQLDNRVPLSGEENFDPTNHKFSEEELKPQPLIKKSKKIFVPEDLKDDKYWSRRKKNNVAAKRSRDARRIKENQIAMRANFLESENDKLKIELAKVKEENERLISRLAKYEGKS